MVAFLDGLLTIAAAAVSVPIVVVALECLAALWPAKSKSTHQDSDAPPPTLAVLIPAHDEQITIADTVAAIRRQLRESDRVVVVADNCTDQTAATARNAGAVVVERTDPDHRGKGYALACGVEFLNGEPPEAVIVIDADCVLSEGSVDALLAGLAESGRPQQAVNVVTAEGAGSALASVGVFAFCFRSMVRARGLARLGQGCLLGGTGMAFRWPVIQQAPLAGGDLAEDMELGLELAVRGHVPQLCEQASVHSQAPASRSAAMTQRSRWEHGHIEVLLRRVPRMIAEAIRQGRLELAVLAIDLAVPPLSLLCLLWLAAAGVCVAGAASTGVWIAASSGVVLLLTIVVAWARLPRGLVPWTALVAAPFYVMWKLPLYAAFIFRRQKQWIRTERNS